MLFFCFSLFNKRCDFSYHQNSRKKCDSGDFRSQTLLEHKQQRNSKLDNEIADPKSANSTNELKKK